jgi:hypothetical protein
MWWIERHRLGLASEKEGRAFGQQGKRICEFSTISTALLLLNIKEARIIKWNSP